MKRLLIVPLFITLMLFTVDDASAQTSVGANIGYNLDAEELFAGGQLRLGLGGFPVIINPSVETYFIEDLTWLQIDINALYPFGVDNSTFTPYAGAGLGINYVDRENVEGSTDAGLNLIAGATFGFSRLRPFAEARINIDDGTNVGIRGGVLFGL